MTTTPQTFGSGMTTPAEAVHVTGRRVVATIVDGLIFGVVYWLLALAVGDIRAQGEAANWASNLPGWASVLYGLFVIGYYILLEGHRGQTVGKMPPHGPADRRRPVQLPGGVRHRARVGQAAAPGRHGRPHAGGSRLEPTVPGSRGPSALPAEVRRR